MNKRVLPICAVFFGVFLLVLSALWGHLFPPSRVWDEEKSQQLAKLGSETNRLKFALIQAQQNRPPGSISTNGPSENRLATILQQLRPPCAGRASFLLAAEHWSTTPPAAIDRYATNPPSAPPETPSSSMAIVSGAGSLDAL